MAVLPSIQVGDNMLSDALLASVEVTQELNQHWWCTIVCRQTEDKRVPVEDFLGKPLTITTTDEAGVEQTSFTGFVLDVELHYEVWGSYTAQLTAVSDSYKLDMTARKQYYAAQTLSSVANTVAGRDGLSVAVHGGEAKALNYVQYGETDFSFLGRIVDDYGCWMRPSRNGLEVFNSFQSGGKVTWRGEDGLLTFRIKGTLAAASISGSHYDHHVMKAQTFDKVSAPAEFYPSASRLTGAVQAQSAQLPPGFAPQRARVMTLDNYQDTLKAESQRSMGGSVQASGTSRNQQLMAGNTVEIDGALEAKGTYGLTRVVHRWDPQGYENSFACTPWKQYRNRHQPTLRSWYGVVSARVIDHHDPKKMGRLQVQFFWQGEGATHWARTVSPHAGPDRGFMFMPEVGDEVAVMFEDGDPERPVILGSMWNGVQQAPRVGYFGADADIPTNDVKRIYTKSGNRMQMVDTPEKETVVLASPTHSSLTMTEKHDSTGRPLVHIHSDGDIILTAPNGRVHVESLFFSREVGDASAAPAAPAPAAPAAAAAGGAAAAAPEGFLHGLGAGLWNSTVAPIGHMIAHPIDTVKGIGHVIAHPVDSAVAIGHAVKETGAAALSGNGSAIGTSIGTVGMLFVPGAGEVGAAEDVARVGEVGRIAEAGTLASDASKVGDVADVAKAGDVADVAKVGKIDDLAADAGKVAPAAADVPSAARTVLSPASSFDDIDALKAANAADVKSASTFLPQGMNSADAGEYLATSDGQNYLNELGKADPTADAATISQRALDHLATGNAAPTSIMQTDPLVKVVPSGTTPSSYSPFFTNQSELNNAISSGKPLGDSFGLPLSSQAQSYDVYQMTPKDPGGALVMQSQVAPTTELGGAFNTTGGGQQYVVPNRGAWNTPAQVGSVTGTGGSPLTFPGP